MALRSGGRKLSFDILSGSSSLEEGDESLLMHRSNSDPTRSGVVVESRTSPSRKRKKHKKKRKPLESFSVVPEDPAAEKSVSDSNSVNAANGMEANCVRYYGGGGGSAVVVVEEEEEEKSVCTVAAESVCNFGELRQRSVNGSVEDSENENCAEVSSAEKQRRSEPSAGTVVTKLETSESLDWKRLMAEDPNYRFSVDKSPMKYFIDEMYKGNSLQSTTILGNEKERERVYDTIFRLPWRCELLIDVGFFVCLDSFLSLLTIMPTRILVTLWRLLSTRQFKRPSAAELSDFGCFIVLACGVALLQRTDISLIYHMIRGQGTIKLYVVYNVLEIFDKLCQSFGGDVLQTLFNSADGLANCSPESMRFWIWRFISDQALAMAASIIHSFILLAQAITLSTCIVAHNNALLALLVSNNFAEIKSSVFKRFSKDNIHMLVYSECSNGFLL